MILEDLESALAEHAPVPQEVNSELPPLTIDGIPVSVDKMTQVRGGSEEETRRHEAPVWAGLRSLFCFVLSDTTRMRCRQPRKENVLPAQGVGVVSFSWQFFPYTWALDLDKQTFSLELVWKGGCWTVMNHSQMGQVNV